MADSSSSSSDRGSSVCDICVDWLKTVHSCREIQLISHVTAGSVSVCVCVSSDVFGWCWLSLNCMKMMIPIIHLLICLDSNVKWSWLLAFSWGKSSFECIIHSINSLYSALCEDWEACGLLTRRVFYVHYLFIIHWLRFMKDFLFFDFYFL